MNAFSLAKRSDLPESTAGMIKDHWKVLEHVDRDTGKVTRSYSYKRYPCTRVLLTSKVAKQFTGWVLIEKDLRNVLIWLKKIASEKEDFDQRKAARFVITKDKEKLHLLKGLFVASLTFYGKCFTKCDGRPVKLVPAQLDIRFRPIHEECMQYRHQFAAHSGEAKLEFADAALVFPKKFRTGVQPRIYRELYQPVDGWLSSNDELFIDLVEHARGVVNAKIGKLYDKLLEEEGIPIALAAWKLSAR